MQIVITVNEENHMNVKISKSQGLAVVVGVLEVAKKMVLDGDIKPENLTQEIVPSAPQE